MEIQNKGTWIGNELLKKERGRNYRIPRCYLDTCILIYAFLEDPSTCTITKTKELIKQAQDFFQRYDGSNLIISPMVMAEFISVAINPGKFGMDIRDAEQTLERIINDENLSISIPVLNLNKRPTLDLSIFDYSIKLTGRTPPQYGSEEVNIILIPPGGRGMTWTGPDRNGDDYLALFQTHWDTVKLFGAIYDILVSAASESSGRDGRQLPLRDGLILSFTRGHKYIRFLTTDEEFVERTGNKPYPDVEVQLLKDFIDKDMKHVTGEFMGGIENPIELLIRKE